MWNRLKNELQRIESKRRSQSELDRLLSQGDHVFRDIGVERADVVRARRGMKFL